MVQIQARRLWQRNPRVDYYKLPNGHAMPVRLLKPELKKRGYLISRAKNELVQFHDRAIRGFLCYEKCSLPELALFVLERGLATPQVSCARQALIDLLKQADEDAVFDRFEELPAEVREMIVLEHFATFPEVLESPASPPITQVCKSLRAEFLPLFYKTCRFKISLRFIPEDKPSDNMEVGMTWKTQRQFKIPDKAGKASKAALGFIRHIELEVDYCDAASLLTNLSILNLDTDGSTAGGDKVTFVRPELAGGGANTDNSPANREKDQREFAEST